jgi:peptidoglycan/LPS O-acetylase OafA/YrhL
MSRNQSLDLLRGIAILMVIGVHTAQATQGISSTAHSVALGYGPYGVQLFFIVSGYTMMLTFGSSVTVNSTLAFYIRRFLRIAPLFVAVALMYLLRRGSNPNYFAPDGVHLSDALLTLSMLHGFSAHALNSIVPGGWSIAIELQFYAIFPLFALLFIRAKTPILVYVVVALIHLGGRWLADGYLIPMLKAGYPADQSYLIDLYFSFWLPQQIVCFGFGFLLFEAIEQKRVRLAGLLILVSCCIGSEFGAVVLALAALAAAVLYFRVINSVLGLLGKHSYAIYLFHFDFASLPRKLGTALFVPLEVAVPLVALLAFWVSYYVTGPLVEDRFNRLGKIWSRRRLPAGPPPPS